MVGSAKWQLNYPPCIGDHIGLRDVLLPIIQRAKTGKVAVIHKCITIEAPAVEAEIRVDYTHLFDGTTTPAVVSCDSSDNAQDKAAGTGALTASILVNDEDDEPTEIPIILEGTTKVATTTKIKRVNDLKVDSWGTGGRPVGTIQVVNAADDEVYAKLAATTNHSVNARVYIPTGWKAMVARARAHFTIAAAAAGLVSTAGVNMRWLFDKGDGDLGIDKNLSSRFSLSGYQSWEDITPRTCVLEGAAGAYISITHQALDTDLATHWASYEYAIIMWQEA